MEHLSRIGSVESRAYETRREKNLPVQRLQGLLVRSFFLLTFLFSLRSSLHLSFHHFLILLSMQPQYPIYHASKIRHVLVGVTH